MLKYVERCRSEYVKGREEEFVKCVLEGALNNQRGNEVVRRGTKALVDISYEIGQDCFIPLKDIRSRACSNSSMALA